MAQVISTQATEIIKKHFPYYEEEFTNEYKIKLHACLFEYADYIANERVRNISSNTMLADEVCEHELWQPYKGSMEICRKCGKDLNQLFKEANFLR